MDKEFKNFISQKAKLERIVSLGIKISQRVAGRIENHKKGIATILFTRMCTTSVSIIKLSPDNFNSHWDCTSLFSLTRNLIEIYHTFYYFSIEDATDDERELRKLVFNLHENKSRADMLYYIANEDKEKGAKVEKKLKQDINGNTFFKQLNPKKQKYLLKGNTAFIIPRETIEERMGNDKNTFKGLYKFLSNQIHSFPMSFTRMTVHQKGKGIASEVEINYSFAALEQNLNYYLEACLNMITLFPELKPDFEESLKKEI